MAMADGRSLNRAAGSPSDSDAPDRVETVDPWLLAGLPGGLTLATYLTTPHAALYRLVVDVLLDAQQRSLTGVRHDELPALLRSAVSAAGTADPERLVAEPGLDLDARMRQLVGWGVVDSWQDRAVRDEDFLRNLTRYQLTSRAARFHQAVRALDEPDVAGLVANLAPAVLHNQLDIMQDALPADPGRVAEAWAVVASTIEQMASAAAGWQATLAGALAGAPTPEKVAVLQGTLSRYVEVWGSGVDVHGSLVGTAAAHLLAAPDADWRRAALHTLGADTAEADVETHVGQYRTTLRTVAGWFAGPDSQAVRLRRQMRDAIAPLVRGRRAVAAVGGNLTRRAELLGLAGRLDRAVDDDQAWRTWCTGTGLFSARHLARASPDPAGNPAAVSFWAAEPVPVEVRLRTQGPRALTGTAARIADRGAGRQAARWDAARRREVDARVRAALLARSGTRLSEWTDVEPAELGILLRLLATLSGRRPDASGWRTARTPDGQWELRSEPPPVGAPAAVVHARTGRLVHPDVRLVLATAATVTDAAARGRS